MLQAAVTTLLTDICVCNKAKCCWYAQAVIATPSCSDEVTKPEVDYTKPVIDTLKRAALSHK
jgi:hypothetical protein